MTAHETVEPALVAGGQFLTFRLGSEQFGLEILRVQEIKGYTAVTAIPNTPAHVKGVMNLRGAVVPVVDLRLKFGMPEVEYTKFTVIVLVTVNGKMVGLVVDAVSDVLTLAASDVVAPPALDASVDTSFITALAKAGDGLISLLDIDRVVGSEEPARAEAA
ncbi:chemotaxis protein CheW [Luteitalea sp. TBR-22]|uniref:chemotaxis protein CheW n=1 Tax=Luteitalea sp. TBR-22 TaxID=2802971 RepID=UPI001AF514AF|nr:chemotaxis protein CheW [Luteitalea sp. TBR-22]BCS35102.1 chemotaxis protein CheW [Luteitalea sp. TBR-22]